MAATSPYSQNDPQAFQFRPMELPMNDIFKGIMVKNQYWNQKAAAIKSEYDTALGLDLTLDENKELRDDYIRQARDEIKKLSAMDLTNPEVQKQSSELFQPLFKDKGILHDDTITKLKNNIVSTAMSYRDKDGGKEYSDENLTDALDKFEPFKNSTSRQDLEKIYNSVKNSRYVPYYDVQKEMIYLRDKCGEISNTKLDYKAGYDYTYTDSGTPSNKIDSCLESLSSKAITQMNISGRVRYNKNYEALGDDLNRIYKTKIFQIESMIAENAGKLEGKGLKEKLSEEEKAYVTDMNTRLTSRLEGLKTSVSKLDTKDYSEVSSNYDELAGKAFTENSITAFSESFYTQKHKEERDANPFDIMAIKHQYNMQEIEYAAKYKKGKPLEGKSLSEVSSEFGTAEQTVKGDTYENLSSQRDQNTKQLTTELQSLYSDLLISTNSEVLKDMKLKGLDINDVKNSANITKFYNFLKGYYSTASAKDSKGQMINPQAITILQPYFNRMQDINERQNLITPLLKAADDVAITQAGEVTISGITFKGRDYLDLVNGTNQEYVLYKYDVFKSTGKTGGEYVTKTGLKTRQGNIVEEDIDDRLKNSMDKVKNRRNEYITQELAVQANLFNVNTTQEALELKQEIAAQIGLGYTTDDNLNQYIQVVNSPLDGTATVRIIQPKDDKTDKDDYYKAAKEKLIASRGNSNVSETSEPDLFKISNIKSMDATGGLLYNLSLIQQAASIKLREMTRNNQNSATIIQRMTPKGQLLEMVISSSGNIFIIDKNNNNTLKTYPKSNLTDAVMFFNSQIK